MPEPFTLPPLRHQPIQAKGRVEGWLDRIAVRAALKRISPWWAIVRWLLYIVAFWVLVVVPLNERVGLLEWLTQLLLFGAAIAYVKPSFLHTLAGWTLHFGRTFPYVIRPWYWLSKFMRGQLAKVRATARTMWLRRLFALEWSEGRFNPRYAVVNWVTVLLAAYIMPIDGFYAYLTYPFGTYSDIVVTQPYRNITEPSTYAIHGYKIIDGVKHEYYFELGPNIWFWQLYPEFMFGQISQYSRCTFHTYGVTLRVPQKLRLFSAGSLYALNPWIVSIDCVTPDIVPTQKP
jgi:hypothetical protein